MTVTVVHTVTRDFVYQPTIADVLQFILDSHAPDDAAFELHLQSNWIMVIAWVTET